MAKFLRIGAHHANVSGYTSKAWSLRRSGKTIFLKWGAVKVRGVGSSRRIYWAIPPREKTVSCRSEKRAIDYAQKAISRRLGHRYERLPENVPIRAGMVREEIEGDRRQATILYVDIVGSTAKAARMGDRRWSEVMNHYYTAVRKELRRARGKEVTTTGDGLLATFSRPAKAVECASAIREVVGTLGLESRAGLHAGEYKLIGAEVVGIALHIGARVAAKAAPGEVLLSSAVRDLLTAEVRLKDRGNYRLKGVPQKWRLFAIDS